MQLMILQSINTKVVTHCEYVRDHYVTAPVGVRDPVRREGGGEHPLSAIGTLLN